MADNKPFRYRDTLPSKLDDKDIQDQIRFRISRNNVKEPKHESKKIVWNPLSALLLDPLMGPKTSCRVRITINYRAVGAIFGDWQGSTTLGFFGDPYIIYI